MAPVLYSLRQAIRDLRTAIGDAIADVSRVGVLVRLIMLLTVVTAASQPTSDTKTALDTDRSLAKLLAEVTALREALTGHDNRAVPSAEEIARALEPRLAAIAADQQTILAELRALPRDRLTKVDLTELAERLEAVIARQQASVSIQDARNIMQAYALFYKANYEEAIDSLRKLPLADQDPFVLAQIARWRFFTHYWADARKDIATATGELARYRRELERRPGAPPAQAADRERFATAIVSAEYKMHYLLTATYCADQSSPDARRHAMELIRKYGLHSCWRQALLDETNIHKFRCRSLYDAVAAEHGEAYRWDTIMSGTPSCRPSLNPPIEQ